MPLYLSIVYGICALLCLSISTFILLRNHKKKTHQLFFLFGLSVFIWILFLYLGFYFATTDQENLSFIFGRLAYGASYWFPLFLTLFFLYFPKKISLLSKGKVHSLLGITIVLTLITIFTPFIHESQIIEDQFWVADTFGNLYPLYILYTLFHLFLSMYLAFKQIHDSRGNERKKIILSAHGLFLFYFLGVSTNVILPLFDVFILQTESVSFSLAFIIPTCYAMLKLRFFGVQFFVLKGIRTMVVLFLFIISTLLIYEGLEALSIPASSLSMIITACLSLLIYLTLQKRFPELTPYEYRRFKNHLEILRSQIFYCNDFETLSKQIEHTFVVTLHINDIKVFLVRKQPIEAEIPIYQRNKLMELLKK